MKTIFQNRWLLPATFGLLLPIALVAGCGGGGSGPSTPRATPTPRATATPTVQASQVVGTYQGTYSLPSGSEGAFILRVQSDGVASANLNEDGVDDFNDIITIPGTVNLTTGQISLSTTLDISLAIGAIPVTISATGTANASGASGPLVVNDSGNTETGTFATTKTSSSPAIIPTPEPTVAPQALKARKNQLTRQSLAAKHR